MSNLAISFNTQGILTAQVILVVREKSDLLTIIYQQAFTANSQHNVTITGLNPVMHQVEVWDTPDGTTLNALKGQCDMDAAQGAGSGSFGWIQFIVGSGVVIGSTTGVCPSDGDTQYVDTGLDGGDYLASKEGFAMLDWSRDIAQISGGGFEFINGQVFTGDESYTVIYTKTSTSVVPPTSASELTDVILHTTNATLTLTNRNKLNVFNFAGTTAVLTMETLAGVADKTLYAFSTHRGSQIYGEIAFQSGEGCYFRGLLMNKIYLGKNETIKMIVKTGVCYAIEYTGEYANTGQRVWDDVSDRANRLRLNGTEYDGLVYKRIWEWVLALPSGQKKSYTDWDLQDADNIKYNNGFFAVDLVNSKFKVPNMTDLGMYKSTNNSRVVGDYENYVVGSHFHSTGTETQPAPAFQRAASHLARNWNTSNTDSSGSDSTDLNAAAGTENKVRNVSQYPVIII